MTLPLSYWLARHPRVRFWLRALGDRGYSTGGRLLEEGGYLAPDAAAFVSAESVLLALEAGGYVRRGGFAPSFSRRAWVGWLGEGAAGEGDVRGLRAHGDCPRKWPSDRALKARARIGAEACSPVDLEWYPTERTAEIATPAGFACVWCETGRCWTAEREQREGVALGAYHSAHARGEGCGRCDDVYPRLCAWHALSEPHGAALDGEVAP